MYQYRINIHRIIDGDTVDVDIDLGFGVWLKKQRIRLYGIDTPESRTRDLDEKRYGLMAKKFLTEQIKDGAILKTRLDKKGKYGRILGEFLSLDGLYKALIDKKRNKEYPQFSDHYFTGDYPVKPDDDLNGMKVKQLSLLSVKSNT